MNSFYGKIYFCLCASLIFVVAAFNWIIDPYGLNSAVNWKRFNAVKPEIANHVRMHKAKAVRSILPRAIILGSSRAEVGLDPDHPGWTAAPVYNLALPDVNVYEALRYLQHAHAIQPLSQVVLALDLFMFNSYLKNNSDFSENRLAVTLSGQPNGRSYADELVSLFTMDAIKSSIQTIWEQTAPKVKVLYLPNGRRVWLSEEKHIQKLGGRRNLFLNSEETYMKYVYFQAPHNRYAFVDSDSGVSTFQWLREILHIAHHDNIQLVMLIAPSHARQWETVAAIGLWSYFESWKKALVTINEAEADKAGSRPFPLWDFSGYNQYTTEEVPAAGNLQSQMRWYRESSHYTKALGDMVLDRVLQYHRSSGAILDDFGIILTSKNIEANLANTRKKQSAYRSTFPMDVAEIRRLAQRTQEFRR